jgi:hypothetical protein
MTNIPIKTALEQIQELAQKRDQTTYFLNLKELIDDWNWLCFLVPDKLRPYWYFYIEDGLFRNLRKLKQSFSNYFQGYGFFPDENSYELKSCLDEFLVPRLKMLKKYHHGYPHTLGNDDLGSEEQWVAILDEMIEGFSTTIGKSSIRSYQSEKDGGYTDGEIDDWLVNEKEDEILHARAVELLAKYYDNLWD